MNNNCPLCTTPAGVFYHGKKKKYHLCSNCHGIFPDKESWPDRKTKEERYLEHINDVENRGYQDFVSPIVLAVVQDFSSECKGLDFGAGTGPVISKLLKDKGYQTVLYDPFFHDHPGLLSQKYDYIVCCEVMEHFHDPGKEFCLLKGLLSKNGRLYCMTDLYNETIDFSSWYYKNDITHVFIYQEKTILWIKEKLRFTNVTIKGRLITFTN
jgi:SAM-dependent methyltransferase